MPKFLKDLGTKLPPNGDIYQRKRKYLVECYYCGRVYELSANDYNVNGMRCAKCKTFKYSTAEVAAEALKYMYRSEFQDNSAWAYKAALTRGILDTVCSHMESKYRDTSIITPLKKRQGIYLLYMENTIVYVGKSTCSVGDRVIAHKSAREGTKLFDKVIYYEVLNKTNLHVAEVYLINKYKPLYNVDAVASDPLTLCIDNINSIISDTITIEEIPLAFS